MTKPKSQGFMKIVLLCFQPEILLIAIGFFVQLYVYASHVGKKQKIEFSVEKKIDLTTAKTKFHTINSI
ncbi:hypothetical protein AN619_07060 [Thermotalea metallivorans]|uniref:Uncharacterized protein n=1 Tax=Thermotalea metallivorans TaxID=520762 RepID=A0A140L9F1_9FIRM|nr:hypothetical protein AN619_07060 [Thermotalea metallivorans]